MSYGIEGSDEFVRLYNTEKMIRRFVYIFACLVILVSCSNSENDQLRLPEDTNQKNTSSDSDSIMLYVVSPKQTVEIEDSVISKPEKSVRKKTKDNNFYLGPVPK